MVDKKNLKDILDEIELIQNRLGNVKLSIIALSNDEDNQNTLTVSEVRCIAILEEVYRCGGIVTASDLSNITKKWGKDPRGSAGYFAGDNPSMKGIADNKRALAEKGSRLVKEYREKYGDDWIDRIDVEYVGNPITSNDTLIHF